MDKLYDEIQAVLTKHKISTAIVAVPESTNGFYLLSYKATYSDMNLLGQLLLRHLPEKPAKNELN